MNNQGKNSQLGGYESQGKNMLGGQYMNAQSNTQS